LADNCTLALIYNIRYPELCISLTVISEIEDIHKRGKSRHKVSDMLFMLGSGANGADSTGGGRLAVHSGIVRNEKCEHT